MTIKDIAQHIGCSPQLIRSAAQRGAIDAALGIKEGEDKS